MKIDRKETISDVWERKQAFLDYENIGLKKRWISIFPNGLVHGFGKKFVILLTFRFMQNTPTKKIGDVLVIRFKKTGIFFKGVSPWFWSKSLSFFIFSVY